MSHDTSAENRDRDERRRRSRRRRRKSAGESTTNKKRAKKPSTSSTRERLDVASLTDEEKRKLRERLRRRRKRKAAEQQAKAKSAENKAGKREERKSVRRRRSRSTHRVVIAPPVIEVPAKPTSEPTWLDDLQGIQRKVVNNRHFAWGVAAYAHVLLLVIFAVLFIYPPVDQSPIVVTTSFTTLDAEEPIETVLTSPQEPVEVEEDPESLPETTDDVQPDATPDEESVEVPTVADAAVPADQPVAETAPKADSADPPAKPEPLTPAIRSVPKFAVSKGSFSAWTEPEFPSPGRPYTIVIQVALPNHVTRYPASDLSGVVAGADGYRKIIQPDHGLLPITRQTVRIYIPIIGAERGLKDSIIVQSRMLRERQLIELNFLDPLVDRREPFKR